MKLTPAKVPTLPPGITRDEGCPGLFVEVNPKSASYKIQSTLYIKGAKPQSIRMALGRTTDLHLEDAREKARQLLRQIRDGIDPRALVAPVAAPARPELTIADMWSLNAERMAAEGCSPLTVRNVERTAALHLKDWYGRPMASIEPWEVKDRYDAIAKTTLPMARRLFRDFGTAWRSAAKLDPKRIGTCPTLALPRNRRQPEAKAEKAMLLSELAPWWQSVEQHATPLRAIAHRYQLLTGHRPWAAWATRWEWIDLPNMVVRYPADVMKNGRRFDMPISPAIAALIEQAREHALPGGPCLFVDKPVSKATKPWHLKHNPEPFVRGHALRHTFASVAAAAGINELDRMLLMHHTIPGIQGVYVDSRVQWERLLAEQQKVSHALLSACQRAAAHASNGAPA